MILNKTLAQLATWLLITTLSNSVVATESVTNEYKNIWTGNAVSDADVAGHVDGNFGFTVSAQTNTTAHFQQKHISDNKMFQEMELRHREMQKKQLEAYKHYLQKRRQRSARNNLETSRNVPNELQTRQKEYIKYMEERRNLINKMIDERRRAADERRRTTLLKMHQTSTTPAITDLIRANKA